MGPPPPKAGLGLDRSARGAPPSVQVGFGCRFHWMQRLVWISKKKRIASFVIQKFVERFQVIRLCTVFSS